MMTKELALILIAAGFGAGVASAQPVTVYGPVSPSVRVSYADLNLQSESGFKSLQARVRHAASGLCLIDSREALELSLKRKHCYDMAVRGGYAQIDQAVAARIAGRTFTASTILISAR